MQAIAIKLNPLKLKNPDLDLRYNVPKRIEEFTKGNIKDNGYNYLQDEYKSICLFLKTDNARMGVRKILELFKLEQFLENDLYLTSEILISEIEDEEDIEKYILIHKA